VIIVWCWVPCEWIESKILPPCPAGSGLVSAYLLLWEDQAILATDSQGA
jgi:hypothetical protein